MTEPVRPLEALNALVKRWREYADRQGAIYASGIYICADELAALLQAAAPPAPTAEPFHCMESITTARSFLKAHAKYPDAAMYESRRILPHVIADLLAELERLNPAAPPAPTAERKPWCQICGVELTSFYCDTCHTALAAPPERVSEGKEQLIDAFTSDAGELLSGAARPAVEPR